jgi:branched-chain amino acid transport system ATP-binding protein
MSQVPGCQLDARHLAKSFGGVTAVNDVSFSAAAGHITGIVGPNGAGKTSLLNLLTGIYRADHGSLLLDGAEVRPGSRPHQRARLGMMRTFQAARVFPTLNVLENVLVGADCRDYRPGRARRRRAGRPREAMALLTALGLADRAADPATDLPSGAQKVVELARVLIAGPRVMLLDEPASGLSEIEAGRLADVLTAVRGLGITVVIVDHNLRLVMGVCDHVVVMDAGQVIATGTPSAVLSDPGVRAAYLGTAASEDR